MRVSGVVASGLEVKVSKKGIRYGSFEFKEFHPERPFWSRIKRRACFLFGEHLDELGPLIVPGAGLALELKGFKGYCSVTAAQATQIKANEFCDVPPWSMLSLVPIGKDFFHETSDFKICCRPSRHGGRLKYVFYKCQA